MKESVEEPRDQSVTDLLGVGQRVETSTESPTIPNHVLSRFGVRQAVGPERSTGQLPVTLTPVHFSGGRSCRQVRDDPETKESDER